MHDGVEMRLRSHEQHKAQQFVFMNEKTTDRLEREVRGKICVRCHSLGDG